MDEKKLSMTLKMYSLNAFPKRSGCSNVINQKKKSLTFMRICWPIGIYFQDQYWKRIGENDPLP